MDTNLKEECLETLSSGDDVFSKLEAAGTMMFAGEVPPLPSKKETKDWVFRVKKHAMQVDDELKDLRMLIRSRDRCSPEEFEERVNSIARSVESWWLIIHAAEIICSLDRYSLRLLAILRLPVQTMIILLLQTKVLRKDGGEWADESHQDKLFWNWTLQ